jgi:hypothetical protein
VAEVVAGASTFHQENILPKLKKVKIFARFKWR